MLVELNGYEYRSTVGVMGGQHMISVSAAVRGATGLKGGDPVPREADRRRRPARGERPGRLRRRAGRALAFFGKLSNSMQRYHVDQVNAAKSADTRQRRIKAAVALFLDGKQR